MSERAVNILELQQQHDWRAAQCSRGQRVQLLDLFAQQQLVRPHGKFDEEHPAVGKAVDKAVQLVLETVADLRTDAAYETNETSQ